MNIEGNVLMRPMRLRALLIVGLALSVTGSAFAQRATRPRAGAPGEWRVIGSVEARFASDHDEIIVRGPFDDFRTIKFRVTDAGLNIQRLVVTYDSGAADRVRVRQSIAEGGESRQISLRGAGTRRIRKIEFWYDTRGVREGKANVTVLGMK